VEEVTPLVEDDMEDGCGLLVGLGLLNAAGGPGRAGPHGRFGCSCPGDSRSGPGLAEAKVDISVTRTTNGVEKIMARCLSEAAVLSAQHWVPYVPLTSRGDEPCDFIYDRMCFPSRPGGLRQWQ
jgi:hypothetical protein